MDYTWDLPTNRHKPERRSIVLQTIKDHRLTETEFFGTGKAKALVAARVDAMHRLLSDGAYKEEVAKHLKRNYTFIRHHINPEYRKRKNAYCRNKYHERKARDQSQTNLGGSSRNSGGRFCTNRSDGADA